jgi:hypothetical protein
LPICGEYSLEEIVLAEDLAVSGETFVTELPATFAAFKALRVPRPVQHLQDETVQNQFLTTSTFWDAGCNKANTGYNISHYMSFDIKRMMRSRIGIWYLPNFGMFTIMRHVQDNTPPIPHIIQKT